MADVVGHVEPIEKVLKEIEENPEHFIVFKTLYIARDDIQRDLGEIKLKDVEIVLRKFALSCMEYYEFLLKLALFPKYNKLERDFIFNELIREKMVDLLKALAIKECERVQSRVNPNPERANENHMYS